MFTTAGSDDKVAFCRTMGADHAINYKTQDLSAEVWRITGKRGVDVVLDMVGGDYVPNATCARSPTTAACRRSRSCKAAAVELDMRHIMMKRLTVTGSTLRASPAARKVALAQALREKVWPLFAQGKLKVVIAQSFRSPKPRRRTR